MNMAIGLWTPSIHYPQDIEPNFYNYALNDIRDLQKQSKNKWVILTLISFNSCFIVLLTSTCSNLFLLILYND